MAKLTILFATFIALLFLVDASVFRTTSATVDGEDDANQSFQSCREQLRMQQYLSPCQDYIKGRVTGLAPVRGFNPRLRDCCNRIQRMQTQCRCQALRMAIDQQHGGLRGQDTRQAYRIGEDLPYTCGVSPMKCNFGSRWLF
ncbi:2S seed storage albumin protein-like [Mercurialis annua]|uniref:2S seed storage albumin protein-like n=1 Tax=Mercurialis annua TaxID=3986 RepID=UPI00215E24F7|nr:2S seed storage albumin protein-like [Mercurialis annua]